MPTPTDLRAALRDAAEMLESYSEIGFTSERSAARAMSARLVALADAPPTVAELLPMVDATHEVHWTDDEGGEAVAIFAAPGFEIVWRLSDEVADEPRTLRISDLTAPGRLVEVSP